MIKVNDVYSIIKGSNNPLSSDVAVIIGKEYNYIYEVGNIEEIVDELNKIDNKAIIISHFHIDHLGNLNKLQYEKLYVGDHTYKYTNAGEIIEDISIENIRILKLNNSHCKGSLCMRVDDYCFVGDGLAPSNVNNQYVYNVQKLKEEIDTLRKLDIKYIVTSHHMDKPILKDEVISKLITIYNKRQKNNPYILVD